MWWRALGPISWPASSLPACLQAWYSDGELQREKRDRAHHRCGPHSRILHHQSGGNRRAIIQNYNSAADQVVNTLATAAKPGQYAILWGTGLGPDGHSDVDAPQPTDIPVNLELYVGGKLAVVTYKGRSGCCSGIDQIVFQVPDGLDGCYVPLVARIGNAVSNFTTMSVAASGGVCSDAAGITASHIQTAQRNNTIRLGVLDLFRADIELVTAPNTGFITRYDQASAVFTDLTFGELLRGCR